MNLLAIDDKTAYSETWNIFQIQSHFTSKKRTDFYQQGCFIVVVSLICNILKSHRAEKFVPLCDIEQQLEKKNRYGIDR